MEITLHRGSTSFDCSPLHRKITDLEKNVKRANYLLTRVLEVKGDLLQTGLGGAIKEYLERDR